MKNNLLKKFLSFSYGGWIGVLIGFVSTPVLTRLISPAEFGKAAMFTLAANVIMTVVCFGTDQSFVRFFYEEEEEKRGALLYNSMKIPGFIFLLTTTMLIIFRRRISLFLFSEENFNLIIILVITVFLLSIYRYATLIIRMQQKGHTYSIIEITSKTLLFILYIIFYYVYKDDYRVIILATTTNFLLLTIISIFLERKFWNLSNAFIDSNKLKHTKGEIIRFAIPLVFTGLINWLFQSFDRVAIKEWATLEELGVYVAAYKVVSLINIIQAGFITFWAPVSYENFEKAPDNTIFFKEINQIVMVVMFTLCTGIVIFKDVIVYMLGKEYNSASQIIPFLILMPLMYTISETTVIGINFKKKTKWHILIVTISCLINLGGNFLLVPLIGAKGAAISTGFSYIIFFSLRTYFSLKYYKVKFELEKFYFLTTLFVFYLFYNTFYNNSILLNIFMGLGLIIITIFTNIIIIKKYIYKYVCKNKGEYH
jgi:O-antigen/teichoic acid export membrane protein